MNYLVTPSWYWYRFAELSNLQVYSYLKLRQEVFIVEQECIYPDIDGLDPQCLHLFGYQQDNLTACLRLIPAKFHQSGNIALGRILSHASQRGSGIGKMLMNEAMAYVNQNFPGQKVQMSAQFHLQAFYQNFGFSTMGEVYEEDGIPHINMLFDPDDRKTLF